MNAKEAKKCLDDLIETGVTTKDRYLVAVPALFEMDKAIQNAKDRPLMIDALPHLLLYLGGISTPLYREELNVISPAYDVKRPRILKNEVDYNVIRGEK